MKFALVGGENLKKYTIADFLWNKISSISGLEFDFEIVELDTVKDACSYYREFLEIDDLRGFNVARPWKNFFLTLIPEANSNFLLINTVFKSGRKILVNNTDILGIEKSLSTVINLNRQKILILGCGGAGSATAQYLYEKYKAKVYYFDIDQSIKHPSGCVQLFTYNDIKNDIYDIIINATTVGKYYFDTPPKVFSTPLDWNILKSITKKGTILQEMNYLPYKTLFLQIGEALNLSTIGGSEMLVRQALESFTNYTGIILSEVNTNKLIKDVNHYLSDKSKELISKTF